MNEQEQNTALQEKLTALLKDGAFLERLFYLETPEEVRDAFAAEGVEMTVDEVRVLGQLLERAVENDGELTEDDLEEVAGGIAPFLGFGLVVGFYGGVIGGTAALMGGVEIARRWGRDIKRFFRRVFRGW